MPILVCLVTSCRAKTTNEGSKTNYRQNPENMLQTQALLFANLKPLVLTSSVLQKPPPLSQWRTWVLAPVLRRS